VSFYLIGKRHITFALSEFLSILESAMALFINLYFISIIDLAASDVYLFFQTFSQRLLNLNKQLQLQLNFICIYLLFANLGRRFLTKKKTGLFIIICVTDSAPCKSSCLLGFLFLTLFSSFNFVF
jgi:hypothetical protein